MVPACLYLQMDDQKVHLNKTKSFFKIALSPTFYGRQYLRWLDLKNLMCSSFKP